MKKAGSLDRCFDAIHLRVPPDAIEERLAHLPARLARQLIRALALFWLIMTVVVGSLIALSAGWKVGTLAAAVISALIPACLPLARRHSRRVCQRFRELPWHEGVSLICPDHGLVYLNRQVLALEQPGVVIAPWATNSVDYEAQTHALVVRSGWSTRSRQVYRLKLPSRVSPAQGEAAAWLFHCLWTRTERHRPRRRACWS